MTGEGSATGKVLLLGEHAVVHGHGALAAALPWGVRVRAEESAVPEISLHGAPADARSLEAVALLARHLGVAGARLESTSDLPTAAGLGSSAAFSVAAVRALAALAGRTLADEQVDALALEAERCFHVTPSGVDSAVARRGGVVFFRPGAPATCERVALARPLQLVLALTGRPRETGALVEALREAQAREPDRIGRLLARLGALAEAGRADAETGDLAALGVHMNEAHRLLQRCGVSCAELDTAVETCLRAGALGAKLTGAGGGGAAIALAPSPGPVQDALRRRGFESRLVELT